MTTTTLASKHQKLANHFLGLNTIDKAEPSALKDFVVKHE
ncbi:hypothetical protein JL09_g5781, partial [Pichia kudriavzevii]